MNTMDTVWLTFRGMQKLQSEHEQLKNYLKTLRSDINSANLSFDQDSSSEKKFEQEVAASKLSKLEALLRRAKLLQRSERPSQAVMGSEIHYKENGEVKVITLVSSFEADPFEGLVSIESPLGKSLLDKKAGDTVHILTPVGEKEYTIVEIH